MHKLKTFIAVLTLALITSACGGGDEITASSCDDVVDQTVQLFQQLIDDIDAEFEELAIEEFVARADDLESFAAFREDSETIEMLSDELGCENAEIGAGVASQVGTLTAETTVGRFVIDAIISGGL
jgi:hypothetical protein